MEGSPFISTMVDAGTPGPGWVVCFLPPSHLKEMGPPKDGAKRVAPAVVKILEDGTVEFHVSRELMPQSRVAGADVEDEARRQMQMQLREKNMHCQCMVM